MIVACKIWLEMGSESTRKTKERRKQSKRKKRENEKKKKTKKQKTKTKMKKQTQNSRLLEVCRKCTYPRGKVDAGSEWVPG
ncbi:hypothetical protein ACN42_g2728 [Penicillium freii]|uniref:Uncharacterized protein n=1 Tax=Penicillium freii TaxID=48697 RepID=A0A117NQR0_PENFR|nr:hypothetical protein ACN42_g2728 [Penicillium freii]